MSDVSNTGGKVDRKRVSTRQSREMARGFYSALVFNFESIRPFSIELRPLMFLMEYL